MRERHIILHLPHNGDDHIIINKNRALPSSRHSERAPVHPDCIAHYHRHRHCRDRHRVIEVVVVVVVMCFRYHIHGLVRGERFFLSSHCCWCVFVVCCVCGALKLRNTRIVCALQVSEGSIASRAALCQVRAFAASSCPVILINPV